MFPLVFLALVGGCKKSEPVPDEVSEPILPYDPLQYVDPFIGTGGIGGQVTGLNPGASMPFGMTLVGPDTRHSVTGAPGFYHFGGYHYDDDRIDGFSHTHSHGMGVNDYGGVLLMPRDGWDDAWTADSTRAAPFEHASEWASPGRYGVELLDHGIEVDIAATTRGAHHTYRFGLDAVPVVVLDLGHVLGDISITDANLELDLDAGTMTGLQIVDGSYSGRFGGAYHHFDIQVDPTPVAAGSWSDPASPQPGASSCAGSTCGGWFEFPEGTTEVHVRVGLSWVDTDGARTNRLAELPDLDWDARLAEAEAAWHDKLDAVRVRGGTSADLRTFHTAHYHSMLMPSRQEDVDGRYRGLDQQIHTIDHPYYSDFSMWDTFRTPHPWYTITDPETERDFAQSIVQMTLDGGSVPRWPLAHGYTGGMVGTPADQILAGTWLKGIDDWDWEIAYDACVAHAFGPQADAGRGGIDGYTSRGWVAWEDTGDPASKTLEYAWNDHALAEWAAALGNTADEAALRAQSGNWANTWDPSMGFFRGRHADGSFDEPIDEHRWQPDFTEGNAWHYRWYVPYDVDAMIDLQHSGDREAFFALQEEFWANVAAEEDDLGPDDWYWHGNEPVLHYAALGSLAGNHAITADAARWVLEHRYDDTPLGLDGNDDAGTLSSWYLFNAIGIYPIAGTTTYAITSPIFERTEIDRPDGTWVIVAQRANEATRYVQAARVNGETLPSPTFTHDQWAKGPIELTMTPNRADAMR